MKGREVALPTHFHAEDQFTFVTAGRRRFLVGGEVVELAAGQSTLIPAGVAHRSLAEPAGVACFNIYLPAGEYALTAILRDVERLWHDATCAGSCIHPEELALVAQEHRRTAREGVPRPESFIPPDANEIESVAQAAEQAGMTREGFSRMFVRRHGMPPHAFWLMVRLNRARELLKAGERIAAAAAETGFADQSHFGRWFLRAFGVTPGCYRSGLSSRSQTFQTRA
nr:AraC family transcriptional regulator [Bradyrhizobium sp. BRP22]